MYVLPLLFTLFFTIDFLISIGNLLFNFLSASLHIIHIFSIIFLPAYLLSFLSAIKGVKI